MGAFHICIAGGLGQHTGSCDGSIGGIALDDSEVWDPGIGLKSVAIHQDVLRAEAELVEGQVHGPDGGLQDVDAVDFFRFDLRDSIGEGLLANDRTHLCSCSLAHLFGVVQQGVVEVGRQDDGSGKHGPCQAASACLVAACLWDDRLVAGT